jgi:GT2 family glycosyltransferase
VPEASGGTGQASKVAIAVLTWNGYATTRACLDSLRRLNEWPVPVAVVDNGSREPEGERLAAELGSPVIAVRLDPNQGVPGGYNAGLKWAAANGFSHVLLMNNDTLVTDPEMLSRLVAAAAAADVAAVTPITTNRDGSTYSAGGTMMWWTGLSGHLRRPLRFDRAYDVAWLDGPCLLVSLDAATVIGGLADEFVTYWEDVDWCVRARRAGYRCLVEPRTSILHLRGLTNPSAEAEQMHLRNRLLFIRRNGSSAVNIVSLAFFLAFHIPAFVARRAGNTQSLKAALSAVRRALAWNVRDAASRGRWRRPADGPSIPLTR